LTNSSDVDITTVVRSPRNGEKGDDELSLLPLPSVAMYILTALGDGPRHGYALMAEIRELSDGTVRLGPGTLYGSIKRMLAQGLIAEAGTRPDPELDDERRKYYEITAFGLRVAAAEHLRLEELVAVARERFGPRPIPGIAT
jgi:DNA-binding PadR family transcriptional regulator